MIDDNADGRSLLSRTLHRKFPQSITLECVDADAAINVAQAEKLDAVIVHRTSQNTGVEIIQLLRQVNPGVPILAVSGFDRTKVSLEAGANRFLNYDQWLMVGTVVLEMLMPAPKT